MRSKDRHAMGVTSRAVTAMHVVSASQYSALRPTPHATSVGRDTQPGHPPARILLLCRTELRGCREGDLISVVLLVLVAGWFNYCRVRCAGRRAWVTQTSHSRQRGYVYAVSTCCAPAVVGEPRLLLCAAGATTNCNAVRTERGRRIGGAPQHLTRPTLQCQRSHRPCAAPAEQLLPRGRRCSHTQVMRYQPALTWCGWYARAA
jgi:hypothetical protein